MKLVSMKAGLAVLALAGAAVLPAYAQTNASATLTLVRYELVDLDLTDCVTPWLSFQGNPGLWSQASLFPGSSSDGYPFAQSTSWSGGTATVLNGAYSAWAQADSTGLFSSVSGGPNLVSAIAMMRRDFLLSPNTGVNFYFYTDLDTDTGGAYLAAVAVKVKLGSEGSPVIIRDVRDGDGYGGDMTASANAYGADTVQGTLWMETYTKSYAAAMPVPEPAAPAMLVGGLALLAFRRRQVR